MSDSEKLNAGESKNLMDATLALAAGFTDVPEIFVRAATYGNSSFLFGKYVRAVDLPSKNMFVNLYTILSSPAGAFRRSTILDLVDDVSRSCFLEVNRDTKTVEDDYENRMVEEFTKEGIADAFEASGFKDYLFTSSEFGTVLLEAARDSSYLRNMMTIFSKLYYGEGFRQLLSGRSNKKSYRIIPRGVYTTMISLMQEAELYLHRSMIRQGFMRRVSVVPLTQEHIDLNRYKPLLEPYRESLRGKFVELGQIGFASRERELIELQGAMNMASTSGGPPRIDMVFAPVVSKKLNEYDKALLTDFKTTTGAAHLKASANLSQAEILTKLSVHEALLDAKLKLSGPYKAILVSETHYERARQFHMEVMKLWDEALDRILKSETTDVKMESYTNVLDQIKAVGKRNRGLITVPLIEKTEDWTGPKNYTSIAYALGLGVKKGMWVQANELVNGSGTRGTLTDKEYEACKPVGGGHFPQVYRLAK